MSKKARPEISLDTIGALGQNSVTIKKANAYKKIMKASSKRSRLLKIVAINVAAIVLLTVPALIIGGKIAAKNIDMNEEPQSPIYYMFEGEPNSTLGVTQDNPIMNETYSNPVINNIEVVDDAVERMLNSGNLDELSSDDIQPKTTSDFLPILQQRLMDLHFLEHDEPTNYYGVSTENAVSDFQSQHDLPMTGIATYQTLLLMFSDQAQSKVIKLGESGDFIEIIQERLNQLGFTLSVNSEYDEATETAVALFQELNGLTSLGSVDSLTEEALFSDTAICADGSVYEDLNIHEPQHLDVDKLVDIAYDQLGAKYIKGAKGSSSYDCSGLVYYCLNKAGYKINYMTSATWRGAKFLRIEDMDELIPGDICIFDGHVGIFIGYNKMIDASSSQGQVRISSELQSSKYWRDNWLYGMRLPRLEEESA